MTGSVGEQPGRRTILHVDMDAFYASVELLRRPELRGQPVVVGGTGERGVVAAASYEARFFGIHSAMPSVRAQRLCPHAVFIPGDQGHYQQISKRVMAIFASCTPHVEPLSLDEAFLDVTGSRRLLGDGQTIGHHIRDTIHEQEGLWCSVGVSTLKFVSKLASEQAKPSASRQGPVMGSGVFEVEAGRELDFLHPLPIRALWGVGPSTHERLARLGVVTVGDLAALPLTVVERGVGKAVGRHLHALARGIDERGVESSTGPKSISHEETFAHDRHDHEAVGKEIVRMSDAVASRLRTAGLSARTISLKIRFKDFETISRRVTLPQPTDSGVEIARSAKELLARISMTRGVRLLGVAATGLDVAGSRQLTLDMADGGGLWEDADAAVDDIRRRFGSGAIGPAVLAEGGHLAVRSGSENPWGPDKTPADELPDP